MKKARRSPKKLRKPKKEYSVEQLLQMAEDTVNDPEQQVVLTKAALQKMTTDDPRVSFCLQMQAEALVATDEPDLAAEAFQEALDVTQGDADHDRMASLHLNLGQLKQGTEALQHYEQGIQHIQQMNPVPNQQLCAAYCGVADLFLTDLCDQDDAEQRCVQAVENAKTLPDVDGTPFIDAWQAEASLRLSQIGKRDQAPLAVLQAYRKIMVGVQAMAMLVGLRDNPNQHQATELLELDAVQNLPCYELRVNMVKLLLECATLGQAAECYQAALDVLGSLLAEDDEVVETWQLTGDTLAAMEQPEGARHHWGRAAEMLQTVCKSLREQLNETIDEQEEETVQQEMDALTCQLDELREKISELPDATKDMEE